jgi:hypothetical protein
MARRAEMEAQMGRTLPGRKPKPDAQHRRPRQTANLTDPDSRLMRYNDGLFPAMIQARCPPRLTVPPGECPSRVLDSRIPWAADDQALPHMRTGLSTDAS